MAKKGKMDFGRFKEVAADLLSTGEGSWNISPLDEMIFDEVDAFPVLRKALEQVAAGHGETMDDPLLGLGIEGFYLLARSCGCDVVGQAAQFHETGGFLDKMVISGKDHSGSYKSTVYNLVEKEA